MSGFRDFFADSTGAPDDPVRREFVACSAAAGLAVVARAASAAESFSDDSIIEQDVQIRTPDGNCDAAFVHPAEGAWPGVLVWSDAFGLRPALRKLARQLAAQGYSVLLPNPFYRLSQAPGLGDLLHLDFQNESDRARLTQLMGTVTAPGAAERDAQAYVGFLLSQPAVNRDRKIGVHGYCMGGSLSMRTAATVPERVGAVASFHGGGLATDKLDSPHLLAPRMKARLYIGIAASDDRSQPEAKDRLREAFAAAKLSAQVEVYAGTLHGWCMPDLPVRNGIVIYSRPDAERAWAKLLELYRTALI